MATGQASTYGAGHIAAIAGALDAAFQRAGAGLSRVDMIVTATIEWAGEIARKAHRTTRLTGLNMTPVKAALARYKATGAAVDKARPATSYSAKGWHAQLRALTGHKHGSGAADRAGLAPTKGTLLSWLAGDREPSKANQARIAEAYGALGTWNVDKARDDLSQAGRDLADALNDAVRGGDGSADGAEVRFFDITELDLE